MAVTGVHHVGIATDDAATLVERYRTLFDATVAHEERFEALQVVFLDMCGTYLELLEPQADGTIARYLDEHGDGLHHVALATDDIDAVLTRAQETGVELVDEAPRPGAWGHEVAFLHPRDTGGVLFEFVAAH
jgi:methylmalonyl-CoA/ethylmalonyl-CoA epimerase